MIEDFVKKYTKLIVKKPDLVEVKTNIFDDCKEITICVDKDDIGKLIGKDGHMISSIKTFISAYKAKDGYSYKLNVENID